MFAHGNDQNALTHQLFVFDVLPRVAPLGKPADDKRRDNQRKNPAGSGEPPRFHPHLPPPPRSLRQPRRNFLPHLASIIRSRIWHPQPIHPSEPRFPPPHFPPPPT